jgi:putative ABC transport system permease protein
MSSWITALRIARREARRAAGRSALVIAMIGLPVLALTFAAVTYDMFRLTPAEQAGRLMGAADARLTWVADGPVHQEGSDEHWSSGAELIANPVPMNDLLKVLPAGSRVAALRSGTAELRTATGVGELAGYGLDVADPLAAGLVTLREGRAPADSGEIAVTEPASVRLGAGIGDTVRDADGVSSWTVTGIVEFPGSLSERVVFRPDWTPGGEATVNRWLWDAPAPVGPADVQRLNEQGLLVLTEATLRTAAPEAAATVRRLSTGAVVAGLTVLEVVLLAGPAFAVGARRRRRELGLVAASGGAPAHLRRIVLADGVVLGGLGAAAGLVLGVAAAFAFRPLVETGLADQRAGGYRVFPVALAGIAALAVGTGVLAALVPAVTAARGEVAAALTGRRGIRRTRKRWPLLGAAVTGAGTAAAAAGAWWVSTYLLLGGLVLVEIGLVICTPALVGLAARLGARLPLTPRIALRDAARNRTAAAAAVAAVMAAVAGGVAAGVLHETQRAQAEAAYAQRLPLGHVQVINEPLSGPGADPASRPVVLPRRLVATLRETMPVTEVAEVGKVSCPAGAKGTHDCGLAARMPAERECPYRDLGEQALTLARQRAANDDPRCGPEIARGGVVVARPDAVQPLTGMAGDDLTAAQAALDRGGVLADPRLIVDGTVTLLISDADTDARGTPAEWEARLRTVTVPGYPTDSYAGVLVSPGAVRAAGLAHTPYGVVAATSRTPTPAEQDALTAALRELDEEALTAVVERGSPDVPRDPTVLVLTVVAGLITLGAAAVGTGLAAADGRSDLTVLAAVGASPAVRRWLSVCRSATIAGLGTVLGAVAGLGASTAVLVGYNQAGEFHWPAPPPYPITVPWATLAALLLVPVVAMLGTGLLTGARLPAERRRTG